MFLFYYMYAIDVHEVAKYFTEELHHQLVREREKLDVAQLVSYLYQYSAPAANDTRYQYLES